MVNQWMVRVEGREYGPVTTESLQEWKAEGRLIPQNELRRVGEQHWIRADELVEIFADEAPPAEPPDLVLRARRWREIFRETKRIYRAGFWRFMLFGLLTAVPLFVLQWTLPKLPFPDFSGGNLGAMPPLSLPPVSIAMLLLLILMWPISAAGFQLVADDILRGNRRSFRDQLATALPRWGRMLSTAILVYTSYFFWFFAPFTAMIALIGGGEISVVSLLLFLLIGAFMVYMNARLFINFLFWQQTAAFGEEGPLAALRESKELARCAPEAPRMDRPLYRGATVASVWLLIVLVLTVGVQIPFLLVRFMGLENPEQAMAMVQAMSQAKTPDTLMIVSDVVTAIVNLMLRPLLAACFVVLYYDAKARCRIS